MSTPKQKRTGRNAQSQAYIASMEEMKRDALRWRALMSSERIRLMGYAGFRGSDGKLVPRDPNGNLHMGVEFWNKHSHPHPNDEYPQEQCRDAFVAYVDTMVPRVRTLAEQIDD